MTKLERIQRAIVKTAPFHRKLENGEKPNITFCPLDQMDCKNPVCKEKKECHRAIGVAKTFIN